MTAGSPARAPFQPVSRWSEFEADLELVPPLAPGFAVYRGTERARQWALRHHYYLARGVPRCAHAMYLLNSCPALNGQCGSTGAGLDHTTVWVPADRPWEPFILTQPYASKVPDRLRAYAGAHGLALSSGGFSDGWHNDPGSDRTLPIRLTAGNTGATAWPLASRAVLMVAADAEAIEWPDEMPWCGLDEAAS